MFTLDPWLMMSSFARWLICELLTAMLLWGNLKLRLPTNWGVSRFLPDRLDSAFLRGTACSVASRVSSVTSAPLMRYRL